MQYYGWALKNRAALMPTREQVEQAVGRVEALRASHHGRIVIDAVVPDYHARFPKPCVGGWGRRSLNVTPSGRVLPCHAAESIPGLEFWSVRDRSLRRNLGILARLQCVSGHRIPARALPELRAARPRLRRLPLPGVRTHRRRQGDRPGLPPVFPPSRGGRARRVARGQPLRLSTRVAARGENAGPALSESRSCGTAPRHEARKTGALAIGCAFAAADGVKIRLTLTDASVLVDSIND